jgi:hypothetical protein
MYVYRLGCRLSTVRGIGTMNPHKVAVKEKKREAHRKAVAIVRRATELALKRRRYNG